MPIKYLKGDATRPVGEGTKVIVHVCNDQGGWGPQGRSFASALSKRWTGPEQTYRASSDISKLGDIQMIWVEEGTAVVNMVAQSGYRRPGNLVPLSYEKLEECLISLGHTLKQMAQAEISVHMPRLGCGLGGADWHTVEYLIDKTLVAEGFAVTVYDLP